MNRNESTNEGGSSPDTVIARSSSEEERQKPTATVACGDYTGDYIAMGDSSSSLDTLTSSSGGIFSSSVTDDRKKSKFGAFKSSFREGGIFKIKKKPRETSIEAEQNDKG